MKVVKAKREKGDLVAERDLNVPKEREDAVLGGPANVREPLAADGASGLVLGPLHDACEAEVVVTAVDLAGDRGAALRVADPATYRLVVVVAAAGVRCFGFKAFVWGRL